MLNITQEDSQFFETKAIANYQRWVKNGRKILLGNIVEPVAFDDGFKYIMNNIASLGGRNLLTIHEDVFPELIYDFYVNLKADKDDDCNKWNASRVNSMEFKFDEALFCRIVEVEYSGVCYYNNTTLTNDGIIFSLEKFQEVLLKGKNLKGLKEELLLHSLMAN